MRGDAFCFDRIGDGILGMSIDMRFLRDLVSGFTYSVIVYLARWLLLSAALLPPSLEL